MRYAALFGLLLILACSDSGPSGPASDLSSGTATLASAQTSRGILGFNFARGSVMPYGAESAELPDMAAGTMIGDEGEILGAFLGPVADDVGFSFVDSSSTDDSASAAFASWLEGPEPELEELAIPVLKNQVWLVRTGAGDWAKILVLHTAVGEGETEGGEPTSYALITFQWVLQSNGTLEFQ